MQSRCINKKKRKSNLTTAKEQPLEKNKKLGSVNKNSRKRPACMEEEKERNSLTPIKKDRQRYSSIHPQSTVCQQVSAERKGGCG